MLVLKLWGFAEIFVSASVVSILEDKRIMQREICPRRGTLIFSSYVGYRSSPKISGISSTKRIIEILPTLKIFTILYLDLKKRH